MSGETNSLSDERIAQEAQVGSLSSFEELVHRYEARIYRFVSDRCRDASDAQEVTQDVFVAAYRAIERFDSQRSFATWLFTIARRKCIDYSRSRRFVAAEELSEQVHGNDPSLLLVQRETGEDLWRIACAVLPEPQYEALWLRYVEEMEVAGIASVMRRTQTHVKVILFRARLKLERELRRKETQAKCDTNATIIPASLSPGLRSLSGG